MTTAIYTHPYCKLHEMGAHHPERPERIDAIEEALRAEGLDQVLEFREAPEANLNAIKRAHPMDLMENVRDKSPVHEGDYYPIDGTYINPWTWRAALRAVGANIAATDAVLAGEIRNAFCLVRPIGHHSTMAEAMGFCVFNSVAIAALHALQEKGLERVAIVDTDVHHGNGTEDIFAHDPRVLMVSYFQEFLYPFSGTEKKRVNMVNVPMQQGEGGETVRKLVTEQWLPALHAHKPQMIFISAGFDAHRDDPLGGLALLEEDYAWITRQIMDVADEYAQGRIVSSLEGGYNLSALGKSAAAHIRTLAGRN